jgi:hypothetical protein
LLDGATGVGVAGGAGVAGAGWVAAGLPAPCITEGVCCRPIKVRPREVHIKTMATMAVSLARKGAAPVEPKTVWLEPPKAAPMPAPLPCCRSTMEIRARDAIIWMTMTMVCITIIYYRKNPAPVQAFSAAPGQVSP